MVRRGATAVHTVERAIPEDTVVHLKVDWRRRFDHMQQHSGMRLKSVKCYAMLSLKLTYALTPTHTCYM